MNPGPIRPPLTSPKYCACGATIRGRRRTCDKCQHKSQLNAQRAYQKRLRGKPDARLIGKWRAQLRAMERMIMRQLAALEQMEDAR